MNNANKIAKILRNLSLLGLCLVFVPSVIGLACKESLGLENVLIPDHQFHASSWTPGQSDPWYGRLGNQSRNSWCPSTNDAAQFLQIDFGPKRRRFTGIGTQGSHNVDAWVTTYKLLYSDDGLKWNTYKEGGTKKIFTGNTDRYSIVKHSLAEPFNALFLRFEPKAWNVAICMRVEAYGCCVSYQPLGVENGTIPSNSFKARATESTYRNENFARLNGPYGVRMPAGFKEFLEVNIVKSLKAVTAVATQGHGKFKEWVTMYSLAYCADAAEWFDYKEQGEIKMFDGNTDMNTVVKHVLYHEITAILIRFNVFTMHVRSSMRVEIYGGEVCNSALGMENKVILDNQISASSFTKSGEEASKGRLNGASAWCGVTDLDFLEIDLGKVFKVQKLATQGHPGSTKWVKTFAFHYSLDNLFWYLYQPGFTTQVLNGNTDQNKIVYHTLKRARRARYVRFQPKTWNTKACMRVELFGCEDCKEPLGFEKNEIPDSSMSATSWYDMGHEPWLGRLYETRGETAWCAKTNDGNQYLQVDLGHVTRVTGVATQGKYLPSWWAIEKPAWVAAYKISFSNDTFVWTFYQEDGVNDKVFTGNSASHDLIQHTLNKEIVARYLRFIPTAWVTWTCLRIEVYGCKACDYALGMEFFHIGIEDIVGSTGRGLKYSTSAPTVARLNQNAYKSWHPSTVHENPYLQIDLGNERSLVTAVATQGDSNGIGLVYRFKLSFSNDKLNWYDYRDEWDTKVFEATKSRLMATKNYLKYPVYTRYIQFWPKEYIKQIALRVEVYGSRGHSPLLSLLVPNKVQAYSVTNTSIEAWTKQIRLNDVNPDNTWCGVAGKFYRLDFGSVKEVRVLMIQGHPTENKWVKTFSLHYSTDGFYYKTFISYWNTKNFKGNNERLSITKLNVDPRLAARFLEIHPVEWNTEPCMRIEVYGDDDCSEALGMENHLIPNKDIKATSWITIDHNPSQARLHNTYGQGAWCSKIADTQQYLEIRLSRLHKVTRIATQGRFPIPDCLAGEAWVTKYSVEYSTDGYTWQYYKENGATKVFTGNQDYLKIAVNDFVQPIKTKVVRLRPVQWNQGICMRVELYGCRENFWPVGIENYEIPESNIRTNLDQTLTRFRLNSPYLPKSIQSNNLDKSGKNFLFIDFGYTPFKVTGLAIQGRNFNQQCVSKYTVSFCLHEGEWFDYMEDGKKKVFDHDEYDIIGIKVTQFEYRVKAKKARVWVMEYYNSPALRVEFYGYKVDNTPLGLSTGAIPDSAITASSQENGYEATNARLPTTSNSKAWCAATPINNEFLKVDLGRVTVVSQVSIGRLTDGKGRVLNFSLSFSLDRNIWEVYRDDTPERKVFGTAQEELSSTNIVFRYVLRFPFRARYVKVYPTLFSGSAPCLTLEFYGKEDCQDELGVSDWRVPNSAMTASTSISNNYLPWMGRVGSDVIGGAWCARYNDANQFLQIDLGSLHKIKSIQIQGKERATDFPNLPIAWVETFTLSSSTEGFIWMAAQESGAIKEFGGNTNEFEVKIVTIPEDVIGRFVRINPKTWHNHICMRVELIGCQEFGELGMENFKIPIYGLQSSSWHSSRKPNGGRLNREIDSNFCTAVHQTNQFLQIDIGPATKVVSGVAIQGRGSRGADWLTEFSLLYSRDGIDYVPYLVDGKEKIFKGSTTQFDTMKHRLRNTFAATSVKIVAKEFHNSLCFRAELYGCDNCKKSSGFGSQRLTTYTLRASSERSGLTVDKAEVSVVGSAWCATTADSTPYLQATFTAVTAITKIVTMGNPATGEHVKTYNLAYSDDGSTWIYYQEDVSEYLQSKDIKRANAMADGFFHTLQHLIKTKYLRISFASTAGELCLKVAFYGHEICKANLGLEDRWIQDSAIKASSSLSVNHSPAYARLNRHLGHGAWCAKDLNTNQYLQVDLQVPHKVNSLALQAKLKSVGSNDGVAWVKGFSLKYSQDGVSWLDYLVSGSPKAFTGITNEHDTAKYDLIPILVGRFVRVVISAWQNRICLRMELYGCKKCDEPLGLESFKIPDDKITGSFGKHANYSRLTRHRASIWKPVLTDLLIYWQVDFGVQKSVVAVVTGGNKGDHISVFQEYGISYSNDGNNWTNYTENTALKIFSGTGEGHFSRHYFPQKITCQYMRILPLKFYYSLKFNAEFYGCDV